MRFLQDIKLIQGGMGVYVSNWRLAQAVAKERPGVTAGTISGTGLDLIYTRLLQLGDPGGYIRQALTIFDEKFGITIGQKIINRFFIEGGKAPSARFKYPAKQILRTSSGNDQLPKVNEPGAVTELSLDEEVIEILIATGFAETWLAKQGHSGRIFMNFLYKIELPLIYTIYGAMLAEIDGLIVGAGNPDGLAAVCSQLTQHQVVTKSLTVLYRQSGEEFILTFDPHAIANGKLTQRPLNRPAFLAIVSSENLVTALANSQTESPDGFIIEHHTAGGHNAGPQGPLTLDEKGQPIYDLMDEPDFAVIRQAGLPFWLAGGYGSREKVEYAIGFGAVGIQAGSIFALAEESGMEAAYKTAIRNELKKGAAESDMVLTTLFSPTGYPFKVVNLEGTLAEESVYESRRRVCDLGLLQQRGLSKPDEDGSRRLFQRCMAEPVENFVKKRGLPRNAENKRCLCNGLLATVGLGQIQGHHSSDEEPAIVTLGNNLEGVRRLSRQGQSPYWVRDVVMDLLG
jgi:nitronate monooxygenase